MSVDAERSWRLLFDIALSHGESLKQQRLTYAGLILFLESAELLGPQTGVFPLLVDRLWCQLSRPASPTEPVASSGSSVGDSDDATQGHRVVGFAGFTDIMNVVSVRCYQAKKLSLLCGQTAESAPHDLRDAIVLSAEDRVRVERSVDYTAHEFLQSFIYKNTIHPSSMVSLDLCRRNDPALTRHTKRLIIYIVEKLRSSVMLPLFRAYAGSVEPGCMSRGEFERFVKDVFPHFTAAQQASAFSIFEYKGLTDLQEYLKHSILLEGDADERVAEGRTKGESDGAGTASSPLSAMGMAGSLTTGSLDAAPLLGTSSSTPRHRQGQPISSSFATPSRPRLIGLDGFVDAMLLLSVVAFADERAFPQHRPITAKIWSTFMDCFCPAAAKVRRPLSIRLQSATAPPLPDPLLPGSDKAVWPVAVSPTLSHVYPQTVPVDRVSSLFLSGLALSVDPAMCTVAAALPSRTVAADVPRRLLRYPAELTTQTDSTRRTEKKSRDNSPDFSRDDPPHGEKGHDSPRHNDEEAPATFLTGTAALGGGNTGKVPTSVAAGERAVASPPPVAVQAAALFNNEYERGRQRTGTQPASSLLCHVFIDEEDAVCIQRGPSQVEVLLPSCMLQGPSGLMKLRVSVDVADAEKTANRAYTVSYTPCRVVPVSLRDGTGDSVYSSCDVTLTWSPDTQTVPASLIAKMRAAFVQQAPAAAARDDAANVCLPFPALVSFATSIGAVHAAGAEDAVRASVDLAQGDAGSLFTFEQALAAIAMLPCTRQLGGDAYTAPNLLSFLHVAFATQEREESRAEAGSSAVVAAAHAPYCSFVDAPYQAVSQKRAVAARESETRREDTLREIREVCEQVRTAHTHAGPNRILPPFPAHLSANPFFRGPPPPQGSAGGGGDGDAAAALELRAVAQHLQSDFIQSQLVIDPFKTQSQKSYFGSSAAAFRTH